MDADSLRRDRVEVSELSDQELFKLLPHRRRAQEEAEQLTIREKRALDELWNRHYQSLERQLRDKIFGRGSTLCPREEPDKELFLNMSIGETYQAFLRRITTREYANFRGFLFTLTLNVSLDVRRKIIGRQSAGKKSTAASDDKENCPKEMVPLDETFELADERKNQIQIVAARELREIVKLVLNEHARQSLKNALSVRIVCGRHLSAESTWEAIAKELLPADVVCQSLGAKVQIVRRKYKDDMFGLLRKLKEHDVSDSFAFEV